MNKNERHRLALLWKLHPHTADDDLQDQITVIRETVERVSEGAFAGSTGAHIHLLRDIAQTIAVGGEAIEWTDFYATIPLRVFPEPTLPTTEVVIGEPGYYNIAVQLGWSSFEGGGSVWATRTSGEIEVTVWPPTADPGLWTTTNGQFFEGVAPAVPCKAGDIIKVYVDADDAATQDLASATVGVYLVDRTNLQRVSYRDVVLADGPIAYWRLDETSGTTAADSAGHALGPFNATYTNGPVLNQPGVMNDGSGSPSVAFDGVNDEVTGADWADLEFPGTAPFTLEAWFVPDVIPNAPDNAIIIAKQQTPSHSAGWEFVLLNSGALYFSRSAGGGTYSEATTAASLVTAGELFYVAATYDGTTSKVYSNGVEVASVSDAVSQAASTAILTIGRDGVAAEAEFDGRLDEVAIYAKALTADQIAYHNAVGRGLLA